MKSLLIGVVAASMLAGCAGSPLATKEGQDALITEIDRIQTAGIDVVDIPESLEDKLRLACRGPLYAWLSGAITYEVYIKLTENDICNRVLTAVVEDGKPANQ